MANTGFKGVDVRQTGNQLVFRAFLQNSSGSLVTTGTTNLFLMELQSDGTVRTYDFNNNTFSAGAVTTEAQAMTYRKSNNGATDTGLWTVSLSVLTGFTAGAVYLARINNSAASPVDQMREFQYGSAESDLVVTSNGTGVGELNVDVKFWNGTAVTAATAGIPDVNAKNFNNISTSPVTTISPFLGTTKALTFDVNNFLQVDVEDVRGAASAGAAGFMGLDWGHINAPTTAVALSGTTISTSQTVASVSGAVGSVSGAVGSVTGNVGGNVVGSVGSVVGNVGGNVNGSVGSVAAGVTVSTNNDKTGYSLAPNQHVIVDSGSVTVAGYATGQDPATLVLDVAASSHNTAGTIGAKINSISGGSGGDPWATILPGSYTGQQAGAILVTIQNNVTGLLGAQITYVGPVAPNGNVTVIRGDDYKQIDGRALTFVNPAGSWPTLTGTVVMTVISLPTVVNSPVQALIVQNGVVDVPSGPGQKIHFELTKTQTTMAVGNFFYAITTVLADGDTVTLETGTFAVAQGAT